MEGSVGGKREKRKKTEQKRKKLGVKIEISELTITVGNKRKWD